MKLRLKLILLTALIAVIITGCFVAGVSLTHQIEADQIDITQDISGGEYSGTEADLGSATCTVGTVISENPLPPETHTSDAEEEQDSLNESLEKIDLSPLESLITGSISDLDSVWDVYVECLPDGSSINCSHNLPDYRRMVSASIIKIFIMGAIFEQVYQGGLSESIVTADLDKMITISDNDATNKLIKLLGNGDSSLGFEKVNKFAASLECSDTELNRLMLDWSGGLDNYTTGHDCARLLRLIYSGECVSADYSKKMMVLLKAQEKNEGLKWEMPDGVEIASKPGFISGVSIGDVGIVFSENMTYIICIICNNPPSDDGAKQKISEISSLTYRFFND